MISIHEFTEQILEGLTIELGDGVTVTTSNVLKNNGVSYVAVNINDGARIAPVIYLDSFYEKYKDGDSTVNDVVNQIINVYRNNREFPGGFEIGRFTEWSEAKKNVAFKIINTEANSELLQDVPHIDYMDLSIVFMYVGKDNELQTNYSILIHNSHMENWKVDVNDLFACSKDNMKNDFVISSMSEILRDMLGNQNDDLLPVMEDSCPMYVLSNKSKTYGAAGIVFNDVLKSFSEGHGFADIIILPSSIHECILLPVSDDNMDTDGFNAMIQEVNSTQVEDIEVLADHHYIYSYADNVVRAA